MHGLGNELQRRGVSQQRQWGARGIVLVSLICDFRIPNMQCPQDFAILRLKCTAAELHKEKRRHHGRWYSDG